MKEISKIYKIFVGKPPERPEGDENIINRDILGPGCEDGSTFQSAHHIHELYASRRLKTV
jgi:hypothetical protein